MSQELLIAASALMGLLVIAGATLKGWQDWLALKSRELETGRRSHDIEGGSREGQRGSNLPTSKSASASSRRLPAGWTSRANPVEARAMRSLADILEEYEFLDADERYRLLIELGRELDDMPQALKTDATLVRGCSASVWVYPTEQNGRLHFLADSNAAITKGIVALVLSAVQDKPAAEVAAMDVAAALEPFDLRNQLSSNRTQGVPNMIALVKQHATRLAASQS
jgi:cysteine desulfuration protein SufE